jgi:hypothetical protein
MDIRNVSNQDSVERSSGRSKRGPGQVADVVLQPVARDQASISQAARGTAAAVANLAERARATGGDRAERVEAARQKLAAGQLDTPAAVQGAAQRLLASAFASG